MAPRPKAVSLASVSRAVDSAVRIAAQRHNIVVDSATILDRWELIGRRLRGVQDMDAAFQMAKDVSAKVNIAGVRLVPVVSRVGGDILVGFVERGSVPKILTR